MVQFGRVTSKYPNIIKYPYLKKSTTVTTVTTAFREEIGPENLQELTWQPPRPSCALLLCPLDPLDLWISSAVSSTVAER